ncbi:hypothetical protein [Sphingomonas kyeonggiensis]|uniref:Uncharacterized protein n=1 Tax=Sphingomonas kyeonggiensis TaxID=1268553 RepID=A0A7W6NX44_9SPHN|nr:hypothetical protein [Sphingomonas kyeonggiensis]MBB4098286.1 hypothetical protein [Sphingomonas kyeonggiensis]
MLLVLSALLLQPSPAADPQEIVVTAAPADKVERVRRFVERVAPAMPMDRPVARFTDPVCVGSAGLPADAGQTVIDGVSEIALSVGLRIGAPGCAPNVLVLFVEDGRAAVRKLARGGSSGLKGLSLADVDRILEEQGPARAWGQIETRSRDGESASRAPNEPPVMNVATSSRLSSPVRRDILRATIVIDRDAVANRDLHLVAAYAAMRGLSGARPAAGAEAGSILGLFGPGGDAEHRAGLSALDRSYLEGLYAGRGDLPWAMKKQGIVAHMVDARP